VQLAAELCITQREVAVTGVAAGSIIVAFEVGPRVGLIESVRHHLDALRYHHNSKPLQTDWSATECE
jgi:hypothetical protein